MTNPAIALDGARVFHGNNLEILPTLADNSVDSIVTDPPYELGFMGKKWDSSGIAYSVELWQECLRVLKPGGHLLAFGGSRTWHRLAVAIEDAGFEVRDSIAWLYGSGFPKSLDIAKSIEAKVTTGSAAKNGFHKLDGEKDTTARIGMWDSAEEQGFRKRNPEQLGAFSLDATTPEAQKWQGWGTALKPAFEPVVVARKPLIGTVAENVLTYGTGGLNIDASRIGTTVETWPSTRNYSAKEMSRPGSTMAADAEKQETGPAPAGRWPANIILDEYTAELLDEQSGESKSPKAYKGEGYKDSSMFGVGGVNHDGEYGDSGGASRFFYVAKASKRDRNEGLEGLEAKRHSDREKADGVGGDNPRNRSNEAKQNFHPTVKPTSLMRYLIKLVTSPNGTVLDPFTGSGSTGKAALLSGFNFIGIELTEEYLPIIEGRLKHAIAQRQEETEAAEKEKKETLF